VSPDPKGLDSLFRGAGSTAVFPGPGCEERHVGCKYTVLYEKIKTRRWERVRPPDDSNRSSLKRRTDRPQ